MNNAILISRIGEALYGPRYTLNLAAILHVSPYSVRRWASGVSEPRIGVWSDLLTILDQRGGEIDALMSELSQRIHSLKAAAR